MGQLNSYKGKTEIEAQGLAVSPGFINMLSWANESLIVDGKSQSDIRQGVTLEVLGEGESEGPLTEDMKKEGTFTDWDFVEIWNIGENQTYPYLRTVPASDINKDHITNFLDVCIVAEQWMDEK